VKEQPPELDELELLEEPAVALLPAADAPAEPPTPEAPPLPALLGKVRVHCEFRHVAPSVLHLQSASVVHHPSIPCGWVPAGLQV
jgi:hypothetical protein